MPPVDVLLGAAALAAWIVLLFARGRFWHADQRLDPATPEPPAWPAVVAVVPARDEADVVGRSVGSLLDQDYPGPFHVVLVDDESGDGTGKVAAERAAAHPRGGAFEGVRTAPRPPGWVGKMWAVHTGVEHAAARHPDAPWLLLTDADVEHSPGNLRRLVARAVHEGRDLASLMVTLEARTPGERLLVPAFVYFFQKLYPFPRVNDPRSRTAGAAGGCMLVRREALERAGGIAAIRGEVIDDCALARAVQDAGGRLWLGLGASERSVRPYGGIRGVWRMVARSAFTQLHHSWLLLAGTVAGLGLVYLVPPALVLAWAAGGSPLAGALGAGAWAGMAASFGPTLALYGRSPWLGFALPVAGALYAAMTVDSALRHRRARGAEWKGRPGAGA